MRMWVKMGESGLHDLNI